MVRKLLALLVVSPFFWVLATRAQTAEPKLAALEKLPASERQQRLYEAAKGEGEAVIYTNMDVSAAQDNLEFKTFKSFKMFKTFPLLPSSAETRVAQS